MTTTFSASADDYVTFYFTAAATELTCDNVYPRNRTATARGPSMCADTGGGWQASCKIPPGLDAGWHNAGTARRRQPLQRPLRIGVDIRPNGSQTGQFRLTRNITSPIADGKTFESDRVRVGEDSAISVWVAGLASDVTAEQLASASTEPICPPSGWHPKRHTRQINAVLPAGLEPGRGNVSAVVFRRTETHPVEIELYRINTMPVLLTCDSIAKSFGSRTVFTDISLSLHDGERLGVIGPNGAGKSTFLQVLARQHEARTTAPSPRAKASGSPWWCRTRSSPRLHNPRNHHRRRRQTEDRDTEVSKIISRVGFEDASAQSRHTLRRMAQAPRNRRRARRETRCSAARRTHQPSRCRRYSSGWKSS